jgi:hypothetical protein
VNFVVDIIGRSLKLLKERIKKSQEGVNGREARDG